MGCFLLAAYWLYSIITSRFKPIQETWSWLSFFLLLVIALEDVWWIDELFFYTNFSSNNACKNPVVFVKFPNSGSVSGAIFAWASGGKHRRFRKGCHISPKKIRVTISFFWFQAFWRSWLDLFFCMVGFFCFFFHLQFVVSSNRRCLEGWRATGAWRQDGWSLEELGHHPKLGAMSEELPGWS